MAKYVIEVARTKDHKDHERASKLIGKEVDIVDVSLSAPLIARYTDNMDYALITSEVEVHTHDWKRTSHLTIQTRNSIYMFRRVVEEK